MLLKELGEKLRAKTPGSVTVSVSSTDRAFGTLFGSEITRRYGNSLEDDTYTVHCRGGGGQSFGAFIPKGLTLRLEGDSNDGFGKGLSGGKLILYPPKSFLLPADENIIVGNVALYGATSGTAFISGVAGERFCVRNSGATAVVEGVGDHGCEYMTGGRVLILGLTGKNFAAGMSGGVVYVLDEAHDLYTRMNKSGLHVGPVREPNDVQELRDLLQAHLDATGSKKAALILEDFKAHLPAFKKIIPVDYERMRRAIENFESRGETQEQAEIKAFYAAVNH